MLSAAGQNWPNLNCGRQRRPVLLYVDNSSETFISHRLALATAAAADGWEIHVATPPSPGYDRLADEGFIQHRLDMSRKSLAPWSEAACLASLHRLFRQVRPRLVHLLRVKPVVYGGIAARGAGT